MHTNIVCDRNVHTIGNSVSGNFSSVKQHVVHNRNIFLQNMSIVLKYMYFIKNKLIYSHRDGCFFHLFDLSIDADMFVECRILAKSVKFVHNLVFKTL